MSEPEIEPRKFDFRAYGHKKTATKTRQSDGVLPDTLQRSVGALFPPPGNLLRAFGIHTYRRGEKEAGLNRRRN